MGYFWNPKDKGKWSSEEGCCGQDARVLGGEALF